MSPSPSFCSFSRDTSKSGFGGAGGILIKDMNILSKLKREHSSQHPQGHKIREEIYWVYQALTKKMTNVLSYITPFMSIQHEVPLCIKALLNKENKFKVFENLVWGQILGSVFEQSLDSYLRLV